MTPLLERLRRSLEMPGPSVGLEIAADRVTGVALSGLRSRSSLVGHTSVPLPAGAIVPAASAVNISDRTAVTDAVRQVLEQLPRRATRVGVVVPDTVAKVSLVHFDSTPARVADLQRLAAWQVRKAVPFRVEDAQIACTPGVQGRDGGQEYVVTLIRRDIVEEYEAVCADAGAHAGLLDLASFNLINASIAMSPPQHADWLLVHLAPGYSTLAVIRGRDLIFFRNRPTRTTGDLADLVHQTAMYYEDRLEGRGLTRTVLVDSSQTGGASAAARQALQERLGAAAEPLAWDRATRGLGVDATTLDPLAASLGLVIREQWLSAA